MNIECIRNDGIIKKKILDFSADILSIYFEFVTCFTFCEIFYRLLQTSIGMCIHRYADAESLHCLIHYYLV